MTKYDFIVEMTCGGCSNAVDRILTKQKNKGDVDAFLIDLAAKSVSVTSKMSLEDVVAILEKSGKKVTHVKTHD